MAVRRVDTLGCHPLVLMKKLAAIGGLEILKEEKHTHDGVDYPYHIVAKVKDGLYVEAKDPLYEQAVTADLLPCRTNISEAPGVPTGLEIQEHMFGYVGVGDAFGIHAAAVINSTSPLPQTPVGLSVAYSLTGSEYYLITGRKTNSPYYGDSRLGNVSKVQLLGEDSPLGTDFSSKETVGTMLGLQLKAAASASKKTGIVISTFFEGFDAVPVVPNWHKYRKTARIYLAECAGGGVPILVSGTTMRIAQNVAVDGLVNPTPWRGLPIFASLLSTGKGLFFINKARVAHSGILGITQIDTTKGNGVEGSFPAVYDSGVTSVFLPPDKGEHLNVLGSATNALAYSPMQLFSPNPPIPVDSVSGGPVVTDLFAYNSEEIRGSVEGLLAARENLPVGTVGWLDGKRYRVHLPGRMLQIG